MTAGLAMDEITNERLHAYLDDALTDAETAAVERALRASPELQQRLRTVREERDRGEHSLGAIWRRERLSCPTREQLTGYLHKVLEPELRAYVEFHLQTVACPTCLANLEDLRSKQAEHAPAAQQRRRKFFESSAGLLRDGCDGAGGPSPRGAN